MPYSLKTIRGIEHRSAVRQAYHAGFPPIHSHVLGAVIARYRVRKHPHLGKLVDAVPALDLIRQVLSSEAREAHVASVVLGLGKGEISACQAYERGEFELRGGHVRPAWGRVDVDFPGISPLGIIFICTHYKCRAWFLVLVAEFYPISVAGGFFNANFIENAAEIKVVAISMPAEKRIRAARRVGKSAARRH